MLTAELSSISVFDVYRDDDGNVAIYGEACYTVTDTTTGEAVDITVIMEGTE